jgi:hypothetical protein
MNGAEYMLQLLQQLRSRGVVVLPNEKTQDSSGHLQYEYDIDYLESQMRGADFERYMTRLDEEISIGLFTPILLLRTADVGSYNLGEGHERIYQLMLNAMNDDRKMYLDKYVINKMVNYNFGLRAPRAEIVFRKMGTTNSDMIKEILIALLNQGKLKFDIEELGQIAGMSLTEIRETVKEPAPAADKGNDNPPDAAAGPAARQSISVAVLERQVEDVTAIASEICDRVRPQIEKALKNGTFDSSLCVNMGFKRRMEQVSGVSADNLYAVMDAWLKDILSLGPDEFSDVDDFMRVFDRALRHEIKALFS